MQKALSEGILDLSSIQEQIEMNERTKFLKKHKYSIWEGKNGKWYTYLPDNVKGKVLKKRTNQKAIEDLVVDFYKKKEEDDRTYRYCDVYNEWVNNKIKYREIEQSTFDRYNSDYNRFIKGSNFEKQDISILTTTILETFIRECIANYNLTAKGYAGLRLILRGVLVYAKKMKYTDFNVSEFFGNLVFSRNTFRRNIMKKEEQVYSADEIEIISKYLIEKGKIQHYGILFSLQTGLRVGELCTIKYSDFTEDFSQLHIQRTEVKYKNPKTGEEDRFVKDYPKSEAGERYVILTPKAKRIIQKIYTINPNGEYVFEKHNRRIYAHSFDYYIRKTCKDCGIITKSMHKIRKTYGTALIDGNVDDIVITEQMGHSDINCTKQYYYFSNKSKEKRTEQICEAITF